MLEIRNHAAQDYLALQDMDETAVGIMTNDDLTCLEALGNFLVQEDAYSRFGIIVLHRHFLTHDGETLTETADYSTERLTLKPVANAQRRLFPASIQFESLAGAPGHLRAIGLEYVSDETLSGVAPIRGSDARTLAGIQSILQAHNKLNRFGVRLLHYPLEVKGRVLLETCDLEARTLTAEFVSADDPILTHAVPTLFTWTKEASSNGDRACSKKCKTEQMCLYVDPSGQKHSGKKGPMRQHTGNPVC